MMSKPLRGALTRIRSPHHINFSEKYPSWGLAGHATKEEAKVAGAFNIIPASPSQTLKAKAVLSGLSPLAPISEGFVLASAAIVQHQQGPKHGALTGVLLRYTKSGDLELGGEHISFVVSLSDNKLLGMARMLEKCDGADWVTPSLALATSLKFLKEVASDLVGIDKLAELPLPEDLTKGQGVDIFDGKTKAPGFSLGAVSVHWIDDHAEKLKVGMSDRETHGMKVKMRFNDNSERYAWVIVDKESDIHVYERNIFWNFAEFKRETQMWLHDGWLQAHGIELPNHQFCLC